MKQPYGSNMLPKILHPLKFCWTAACLIHVCRMFSTIYLPSKYPIGSVIPEYTPDADICRDCIAIARRVDKSVKDILGK